MLPARGSLKTILNTESSFKYWIFRLSIMHLFIYKKQIFNKQGNLIPGIKYFYKIQERIPQREGQFIQILTLLHLPRHSGGPRAQIHVGAGVGAGRMLRMLVNPTQFIIEFIIFAFTQDWEMTPSRNYSTECLNKNLWQVSLLDNCILISKSYYKGTLFLFLYQLSPPPVIVITLKLALAWGWIPLLLSY